MGEKKRRVESYIKAGWSPAWIVRHMNIPLKDIEQTIMWYKLCKSPE